MILLSMEIFRNITVLFKLVYGIKTISRKVTLQDGSHRLKSKQEKVYTTTDMLVFLQWLSFHQILTPALSKDF